MSNRQNILPLAIPFFGRFCSLPS